MTGKTYVEKEHPNLNEGLKGMLTKAFDEGMKQKFNMTRIQDYPLNEWHLTKNELPELQTATDTGEEYNTLVLCFWYDTDSRGKKAKVYDLDRWDPWSDIWESGKQRDEVEAWMYVPEPPEEI